jgi:hypothetical protein
MYKNSWWRLNDDGSRASVAEVGTESAELKRCEQGAVLYILIIKMADSESLFFCGIRMDLFYLLWCV